MSAPRPDFSAIAIGGSAGAIDALMTLLPRLPATLRASILIVLHLPRDKPSLLVNIFAPRCALQVYEAQHGRPLEPGSICFAPPDYHLLLDQGPSTSLSVDAPVLHSRPSIDVLFESAADVLGPQLIGVLLSGANGDGAQGLSAIAAAGGLALVQSPESASSDAMPRAALKVLASSGSSAEPACVATPEGLADYLTYLHQRSLL